MESGNKAILKAIVAIVCVLGSAMAIYNVNSDNSALQKRADQLACPGGCQQLVGLQRNPTSQTFTFQVKAGSAQTKIIECTPAFLLFGEYDCKPLN